MRDERIAPAGWPRSQDARRNVKHSRWHDDWTLRTVERSEFHPEGRVEGSDYNQHYVDLEAPWDAQDDFSRRSEEIAGRDPDTRERHPRPDLASRFRGAVLGAAIGDALARAVADDAVARLPWRPALHLKDDNALVEYRFRRDPAVGTAVTHLMASTLEGLIRARSAPDLRVAVPAELARHDQPSTPDVPPHTVRACETTPRAALAAAVFDDPDAVFSAAMTVAALGPAHPDDCLTAAAAAVILHQQLRDMPFSACVDRARAELARRPDSERVLGMVDLALSTARGENAPVEAARLRQAYPNGGADAAESLGIALYCAISADYLREACLLAVNYADPGSVACALSGLFYGAEGGADAVPADLGGALAFGRRLDTLARDAVAATDTIADQSLAGLTTDQRLPKTRTVPRYRSFADGPVRYVTVAGDNGPFAVIWVSDAEDAASMIRFPGAGSDDVRASVDWEYHLRQSKRAGLTPSQALDRMRDNSLGLYGAVVAGSDAEAAGVKAVYDHLGLWGPS